MGQTDVVRARARPFLKWAGGKNQLVPEFARLGLFPPQYDSYLEPFLGGGAVFFAMAPKAAVLLDANAELVLTYQIVRDQVEQLAQKLAEHARAHSIEHYYNTRSLDVESLDPVERAARLIYLNKTCFNGLYRVNSKGKFNVPIGRYAKPSILNDENLKEVSRALEGAQIRTGDFSEVVRFARAGDFVYLDPPYVPLSSTASFTSYTKDDFGRDAQERLARVAGELDAAGCRFLLSNSDTDFVRDLYSDFSITEVSCARFINSKADRRGPITELAITNYQPGTSIGPTFRFGGHPEGIQ